MNPVNHLTWLHVSDLHFGHGDAYTRFDQVSVTNAIIGHAAATTARLGSPDVIFVTGDLAFSGQPDQFAQGRAWIERLVEAVGGKPRIFLIPGNHDVDRSLAKKMASGAVHEKLRADPKRLDELLSDADELGVVWRKLSAFADCAKSFEQPWLTPDLPFFVQEIPCPSAGKILVVGLNTALLSLDDEDSNKNLALGRGQLLKAVEERPMDALLLVLQHHPPEWLQDGGQLNAVLQQRAHLQFSGHVHQQQGILHVPLLGGSRLQFVAGAGHKDMKEEGKHGYAWGQLRADGLAYFPWFWDPDRHAFLPTQLLPTDDFYRADHAFVELARLPKSLQNWLSSGKQELETTAAKTPAEGSQLGKNPETAGTKYGLEKASFYIPYRAKGNGLVGRERELAELNRLLGADRATRVALCGIGGLGKTQLAAEYCHLHKDLYPGGIYWLDAAPDQNLEGQLIALCDRAMWLHPDSKHADKLAVAIQRLRRHSDSLLVFDNVEVFDSLRAYLPEPGECNGQVLVLSRAEIPGSRAVRIDALDQEGSVRLLELVSERLAATEADKAAAEAISRQLDGLPLALELVGAYLSHRSAVSWSDCAADLQRRGTEAQSLKWAGFADASATKHAPDLYAALALDDALLTENPLLRRTLDLLALAGPASIGIELLGELLENPEAGDLVDALALAEKLRILWLEPDEAAGRRFRMHRLVQQVRRRVVSRPQGTTFARQVRRIADFFSARKADFRNLAEYEVELPHLEAFQELAVFNKDWPSAARLRWLQAYPPYYRGRFQEAQLALQESLAIFGEMQVSDQMLEAEIHRDLGIVSTELGNYSKALLLGRRALELCRRSWGADHLETATAMIGLALTLRLLWRRMEAKELIESALAIRREKLGHSHPQTLAASANLALIFDDLEMHDSALELGNQVLEIQLRELGSDSPSTATTLCNLGVTHLALNHPEKALELTKQALYILRNLLGEKHPETSTVLGNLASIYKELGDHEQAQELENETLKIRSETLGPNHPITAIALGNQAGTLLALKKYQRALHCALRVLKIRLDQLGSHHPETTMARIQVAHCQKALGRGVDALQTVEAGLQSAAEDDPSYPKLQQLAKELRSSGGKPLQKGFRQPAKSGNLPPSKTPKSKK